VVELVAVLESRFPPQWNLADAVAALDVAGVARRPRQTTCPQVLCRPARSRPAGMQVRGWRTPLSGLLSLVAQPDPLLGHPARTATTRRHCSGQDTDTVLSGLLGMAQAEIDRFACRQGGCDMDVSVADASCCCRASPTGCVYALVALGYVLCANVSGRGELSPRASFVMFGGVLASFLFMVGRAVLGTAHRAGHPGRRRPGCRSGIRDLWPPSATARNSSRSPPPFGVAVVIRGITLDRLRQGPR